MRDSVMTPAVTIALGLVPTRLPLGKNTGSAARRGFNRILGGSNLLISSIFVIISIVGLFAFLKVCTGWNANYYERFETDAEVAIRQKKEYLELLKKEISRVSSARERLAEDITSLGDAADDTCSIMKMVEERYVGAAMAPTDETEAELPQDVQKKRQAERRTRALQNFQQEKKMYMTTNKDKGPIYECFTDSEASLQDDISDAELNLTTELNKLHALLDSAEVRMATVNGRKINSLLGFNAGFLKKGIESIKPPEGFANPQDTMKLLAKSDELVGKAHTIHLQLRNLTSESFPKRKQWVVTNSDAAYNAADSTYNWIAALKADVANQKAAVAIINKKTNAVGKGDVPQSDMDAAINKNTTKKTSA